MSKDAEIAVDGDRVTVDGAEVGPSDVHKDEERFADFARIPGTQLVLQPGALGEAVESGKGAEGVEKDGDSKDGDSDSGVSVEETLEECFINDARFGEFEDVRQSFAETPELLNARNDKGATALMMAATNNHIEIVEFLLGCSGIDLNQTNDAGNTALHWAAGTGRKKICSILLGAGADADVFNGAQKKAFDLARASGFTGVCEVLAPKTNFEYCSPEVEEDAEKHRLGSVGGA